ncbi:hypothetical protein BPUTSESOX_1067 [uncultured Gammaproteobacteria bacterium]|nr:hypothetical protein [uncultured Gammaproteobacteria bacterium]SSC10166.1 hypothetical protein BPUTEOSOX_1720 [thiotrophic endosymbiont of Bathymodiolus puteoserpentis (Logatchev)]CAC9632950.1 hypothetical protein [uncultured Gammaproteobacteria bacterium]CAC9633111.1 hypothetical protein [uncultured Gammaproteobacteria bacterium]CAC9662506.1 hypothetical protein [uncultured Gammaproteobacteria bacterium]
MNESKLEGRNYELFKGSLLNKLSTLIQLPSEFHRDTEYTTISKLVQ